LEVALKRRYKSSSPLERTFYEKALFVKVDVAALCG
jgi:hypothetical protein